MFGPVWAVMYVKMTSKTDYGSSKTDFLKGPGKKLDVIHTIWYQIEAYYVRKTYRYDLAHFHSRERRQTPKQKKRPMLKKKHLNRCQ